MGKFYKTTLLIVVGIVIVIGFAIAYVTLILPNIEADQTVKIEPTPERVARGKYLANHVAVCMDCHSTRKWDLFAGPMAAEGIGSGGEQFNRDMGFPGEIHAPNITPAGIGDWSDGEVLRAVTSGVNKEGKALFPVMNYHRFGQMDKEDVYGIIAYLRTLEPVKSDVPASVYDFPVNILINTFPKKARYQAIPPKSDANAYGKYLVNASGCVDCHSKTDKGNIISGTEFGGGMVFNQPAGSVTAPNITPHPETGIGNWTKDMFIQRFKLFTTDGYQAAKIGKNDLNTPMPWNMYAGMTSEDLSAIYTYLKSLDPIDHKLQTYSRK